MAEGDAEAARPEAKTLPPEDDAGEGEGEERGGSDAVEADAPGFAQQQIDVEVADGVEPGAVLGQDGAGLRVGEELELLLLRVGGVDLEGRDGGGG